MSASYSLLDVPRVRMSSGRFLAALFLAVAILVAPSTVVADDAGFIFKDEIPEFPAYGIFRTKPWQEEEKEFVKRGLENLKKRAPGLYQRATAYRPVTLFRVYQNENKIWVWGSAVNSINGIAFTDRPFVGKDREDFEYNTAHELAHLIDSPIRYQSDEEWFKLIGPKIDRFQARLKKNGMGLPREGISMEEYGSLGQYEPIALQEGLPSLYASVSPGEALAECVQCMLRGWTAPEAIRAYIEKRYLSFPYQPEPMIAEFHKALQLFHENRLDPSEQILTRLLESNPAFKELYYYRGEVRKKKGKPDLAIADYDYALEAYRKSPQVMIRIYRSRATAWSMKRQYEKAIADESAAIALAPDQPLGYLSRGRTWSTMDEAKRAIEDFTTAIRKGPAYLAAYEARAMELWKQKSYAEAEADYTTVIRIAPKTAWAFESRGSVRLDRGAYQDAIVDFTEAIALLPRSVLAHIGRGKARAATRDFRGAIEDFTMAAKPTPFPMPELLLIRGKAYVENKEYEKGMADLKKSKMMPQLAPEADLWIKKAEEAQAKERK